VEVREGTNSEKGEIEMKCFHHNDLDGRCAAAIVKRYWKNCEFDGIGEEYIELDYKDKIYIEEIVPQETINIVDFSFKPDVMEKIFELTKNVIWIDHHKTAKDYPYQHLKGLRDFTDKSMSGCELAWKYFFPDEIIPQAVILIGDYDKWALKHQPKCFQFYEGLKMEITLPDSPLWVSLLSGDINLESKILIQGKSAIKYRDNYCDKICNDFGYEIEWEGYKAFATNFYQFGSKGFGFRVEEYDFCIAYIHDGQKFTVSLYSVKDIDVSQIAKKYGGGGHKGAAGFITKELPFIK